MDTLHATPAAAAPELIDYVDFKWLMAAAGHRVHLERLLEDADYAAECLDCGARSRDELLRRAAQRLQTRLR